MEKNYRTVSYTHLDVYKRQGQTQLENEALKNANKILFCDTNVLVTKVFSDINYNSCDAIIAKAAKKHKYDLIFLTDVDVPWEKDDLRDKPDDREKSIAFFEQALVEFKTVSYTHLDVYKRQPLDRNNHEYVLQTAQAGEFIGNKLIYLEAGSGAKLSVPKEMIRLVSQNINVPLIVGGGIRSKQEIENAFNAGADLVVIGTAFEKDTNFFIT